MIKWMSDVEIKSPLASTDKRQVPAVNPGIAPPGRSGRNTGITD